MSNSSTESNAAASNAASAANVAKTKATPSSANKPSPAAAKAAKKAGGANTCYLGLGRRKESTARVYIKRGAGDIVVNHKSLSDYFGRETARMIVKQPLELLHVTDKFDIRVNVKGGGPSGQAGAIRLGITRALIQYEMAHGALTTPPKSAAPTSDRLANEMTKQLTEAESGAALAAGTDDVSEAGRDEAANQVWQRALRRAGYVTRDPRCVERKKVGLHKARRKPQFSKR